MDLKREKKMCTNNKEHLNQILEQIILDRRKLDIVLEKLNILDEIKKDLESIKQTNREFAERHNKKSCEQSEKLPESTVEKLKETDFERLPKERKNDCDKIEHLNDQNITWTHKDNVKQSVIKNDSVRKKKKTEDIKEKQVSFIKSLSKIVTLLKLEETRTFRRQKKVKCDDGG